MKRIYAYHLLNDYSGSPKVLRQLLKGWAGAGHEVFLQTSLSKQGFLSELEGVHTEDNAYRFHQALPYRLLALLRSQLTAFWSVIKQAGREDIVYINTILPFGAAIAGKLKGARVIYHIHETSVNPLVFKRFLLLWVRLCATEVIYVSDFLAQAEPLALPAHILWNALEDTFLEQAEGRRPHHWGSGTLLMIASLKRYKGVDEFVDLAVAVPDMPCELVVNATTEDIAHYFTGQNLPDNLTIYPVQQDVHPFYQRAAVVLNLSRPEEWQETFGLTALEAMAYGLPVIVPPVGGIAEIVLEGQTGFHLNGKDTLSIKATLETLRAEPRLYQTLSRQALAHAKTFAEPNLLARSKAILCEEPASRNKKSFRKMEHFTK